MFVQLPRLSDASTAVVEGHSVTVELVADADDILFFFFFLRNLEPETYRSRMLPSSFLRKIQV